MDVAALHSAAKECYWTDKDLPTARRNLEEGIAIARSHRRPDQEKPLQYDLASFCWPGWDEAEIRITEDDRSAGEQAAIRNLQLAEELRRGDAAMAKAWFMVGGYHLDRGRYLAAEEAFERQAVFACQAGDLDGNELAEGYCLLAGKLAGKRVSLDETLRKLRASTGKHGREFAKQLETVARVYGA